MKLLVRLVEARNLRAMDSYVRLQLGKQKFKTKVVKKNSNPSWGEEFSFRVEDPNEELFVSVLDEDKYFNNDFVGHLKLPVSKVLEAEEKSLGTIWYTLQPKNKKSKNRDCGEILLTISLSQNNSFIDETLTCNGDHAPEMEKCTDLTSESSSRNLSGPSRTSFTMGTEESHSVKEEKSYANNCPRRLAQIFPKNGETASNSEVHENKFEGCSFDGTFDEAMKSMKSNDQGGKEIPSNLSRGILLDQSYVIAPSDLNYLLFSPDSKFPKLLAELQGTKELQHGPWRYENGGKILKRVATYLMAATKLMKAVKANEEQVYLKADGKVFAVIISVSTPDVMYGSTFKTEFLYCIKPGPELPSGEQSSQLVISWQVNFLKSTMMRSMIEGGARQGLKGSFERFADLLSQNVKLVDLKDCGSNEEQVLASL